MTNATNPNTETTMREKILRSACNGQVVLEQVSAPNGDLVLYALYTPGKEPIGFATLEDAEAAYWKAVERRTRSNALRSCLRNRY